MWDRVDVGPCCRETVLTRDRVDVRIVLMFEAVSRPDTMVTFFTSLSVFGFSVFYSVFFPHRNSLESFSQ